MKNMIKVTLLISLLFAVDAFAAATSGASCQEVTEQLVSQCRAGGMAAGSTTLDGGAGAYGDVNGAGNAAMDSSRALGAVGNQCANSAQECQKKCKNQKEAQQCMAAVQGAAGTLQQQSASMGGDASQLLGAAAMMGAAALPMLMKKDDEDEQQKPYDGALRPDGTVDCSKADAFNYSACDSKLAETCKTAMSDSRCVNFANRYCNSSGTGSSYCNTVVAYQFCTTGGGHPGCPSCMQLNKETSDGCINNPAACMAQNSPEETEKMRPQCPNDPVFQGTSPTVVVSAPPVTGAPSGTGGVAQNPGLPAPILPAGGAGNGATASTGIASPTGAAGQVAVMSAARDVASGTKVGSSTGPASDVNGQFGPSLFATSSQLIRSRCAAGQFNNCP